MVHSQIVMQKSGAATVAAAAAGATPIPAHLTSGVVAYVHALAALMTASGNRDNNCSSHDLSLAEQSREATDGQFAPSARGGSKAKDVSLDELNNMYSHKYGVGIDQALKALGGKESLPDFVGNQKAVVLKDETAAAVLCEQLSHLVRVHPLTPEELGLLYCYTHGGTVCQALKAFGREGEKLQDFLDGRPGFVLKNGRVEAESTMDVESISSVDISDGASGIEAEIDEVVDAHQWRSVGARFAAVLRDKEVNSEEVECVDVNARGPVADGYFDDVCRVEAEVDKEIDVSQWRDVGVRLTAVVNTEIINGEEEEEKEERIDVNAWGSIAVRLAATFRE